MSRSSHPSVLLRLDQRGGSQVMWVGHVPRLPCAQEPGMRLWLGCGWDMKFPFCEGRGHLVTQVQVMGVVTTPDCHKFLRPGLFVRMVPVYDHQP